MTLQNYHFFTLTILEHLKYNKMIQIYHNPRCGKSRNCLAFIDQSKQEYEIIPYLTETPNFDELKTLLEKLNLEPIQLVRTKESIWTENYKGKNLSNEEIIKAMTEHPILIERPIVINGDKAVIARPMENAAAII